MDNQTQNATLSRYYSQKKRRKKRKKVMFYTLLTVFMVLVIMILSLTVFFNINEIKVEGNAHYTQEDIIRSTGMEIGDNMFRLNKFKIITAMKAGMPYLSDVIIRRNLPSEIVITVTEAQPYGAVIVGTDYCIVDENLKILEFVNEPVSGIPIIYGITPENTQAGTVVTDTDGICQTLTQLTQAMKTQFGPETITTISTDSIYELSFVYEDRITVALGTADKIVQKLRLVKYVIDENPSKEHAQIDVSSGEKAYYRSVNVEQTEDKSEQ